MSKESLPHMKIILNTTDGSTMSVDVRPDETYRQLKERVCRDSGVILDVAQIYYDGKKVDEDRNVYESFFGASPPKVTPVSCAVKGCTIITDKEIFRFPNESERCNKWLTACHREDLLGRSAEMLNAEFGVCADHFKEDCFLDGSLRRRLRKGSVPEVDSDKNEEGVLIKTLESGDELLENSKAVAVAKGEFGVTYVITQDEEDTNTGSDGLLKPKEEINLSQNVMEDDCNEQHDTLTHKASQNHVGTKDSSNQIVNTSIKIQKEQSELESGEDLEPHEQEMDPLMEDEEEDDEIDEYQEHPGLLCRLCAKSVENAHFIFGVDGQEDTLAKKINFSLPVKVQNTDHLPKQLCSECVSMVEVCHNFSMACVQAENDLKILAKRKQFRCKVEKPKDSDFSIDSVNKTIKPEVFEKEIEDSCYACPLCVEGRMNSHSTGDNDNDNESQITDTVDDPVLEDDDGTTACAVCAVPFGTIESLLEHARSHTVNGKNQFPCGYCGSLLTGNEDLKVHVQLHCSLPGDAQYQCGDCGILFDTEERAEFHQECGHRQDGDNFLLTCPLCEQSFLQEEDLWDHTQSNHRSTKAHYCEVCSKSFMLFSRLKAHLRTHSYEYVIDCDVCEEKFSDVVSLKTHVSTVHSDKKPFQCDQCGRCYTRKSQFTAHVRSHNTELTNDKKPRAYTCRLCGEEGFESLPKLLMHRRTEHQDSIVPLGVKKEKMYKCGECDKAFTGRVALKHHMMNHNGELPHVCEFCNKGFTQKRSLILHRRTHTGEKPYGCQECGKRFVQSAHLYSHLRLHTGEKPYSCSECDATFRLKDVRDSHQRKHTGERPFKCKVCGKTFRTSHSYYQHTWIHTGRKPYPCTYCGKAFRRSNGLKVHIRIHTGEKPHVCEICGRGFAQKQDMKKHRNLHAVGKL